MNNLTRHLCLFPASSASILLRICRNIPFDLQLRNNRAGKLGDFRYPDRGEEAIITLNKDANKYRFLLIFIHELAHLTVWLDKGRQRYPHGKNWKVEYSRLLQLLLGKKVFPRLLESAVRLHSFSPRATNHGDLNLVMALREYDPGNKSKLLIEIPANDLFKLDNGKVYRKGEILRTRVLCCEVGSRRKYLIHSHAEVTAVKK